MFCPAGGCQLGGERCEEGGGEVFRSWERQGGSVGEERVESGGLTKFPYQRQPRARKQHLLSHRRLIRYICNRHTPFSFALPQIPQLQNNIQRDILLNMGRNVLQILGEIRRGRLDRVEDDELFRGGGDAGEETALVR